MKFLHAAAFLAAALFMGQAHAATLYISEFANGVSTISSQEAQIFPQAAIADQAVAISGSSVQSAAFNSKTHAVTLICDEGCSVAFGNGTAASPSATTSNYLLQQGVAYYFAVFPGTKMAAIANAAGNIPGSSSGSPSSVVVLASENHIGEVGSNQINKQIAQTVTASSAYTSGNSIGALMTVTNAARVSGTAGASGTGGLLQSVGMNAKDAQTTPVDLFVFNANPSASTCTDKTAFVLATADFDKVIGVVHMSDFTAGNTASFGQTQNLAMPYTLASATSIYACAVTRSTPTYGSTSDISFGFELLRD